MTDVQQATGSDDSVARQIREKLGGRPLVLVGLMGSGKSSVGKRLAARLGLDFIDSDHEIEQAANLSITEIFANFGEPYFRSGERRVIARLLGEGSQVLATGGGAFMDPETRTAVKSSAVSLWLNADLRILMSRVRRRPTRPLLQNDDPEGVMKNLMDERYPVYALADLEVRSRDVPHEVVVQEIIKTLCNYLEINEDINPPQKSRPRRRKNNSNSK